MWVNLFTPGNDVLKATISGEYAGFNLWEFLTAQYGGNVSSYSRFIIDIEPEAVIGASGSGYAFTTGAGWPSGIDLTINNYGYIAGYGGDGGGLFSNGSNGGDAMLFTLDATLFNASGAIIGGGGGGGGGKNSERYIDGIQYLAGGGGGAGWLPGVGGAEVDGPFSNDGTMTSGGTGLLGGGNGGGLGQAGSNSSERSGGAAGDAIHKNGFTVSVTNNGTIAGTISATT